MCLCDLLLDQTDTTCCYSITTPTMPTTLYESAVSSALTVTTPTTGITVTVSSSSYSAAASASACNTSAFSLVRSNPVLAPWPDLQEQQKARLEERVPGTVG